MSATIDPAQRVMTLINVFTVDPGRQQELVDLLDAATEGVMKKQPGFISANIHKSADGRRVINYAQWRSKGDFEAMRGNLEAAAHMKIAGDIASFDPIICDVVSSHTL